MCTVLSRRTVEVMRVSKLTPRTMVCKAIIQFQPRPDSFSVARNVRLLPRCPVRHVALLNLRRLELLGGPLRNHRLSDSEDERDNNDRDERNKDQDYQDFQGPWPVLHRHSPLTSRDQSQRGG